MAIAPAGTPAQHADVAVSGRSNAYPSVVSAGDFVALAWGATVQDGATDIYAAVSRDGGRTFGAPVRVSDGTSAANLSGEQPPRVSLVPRSGNTPSVVVTWTSKGAAGTRIVSARSNDGGRSFGGPAVAPGSTAAGNRGWHSTGADSAGRVVAIWLDHRELAAPAVGPSGTAGPHQHGAHGAADGVARAQLSKLYFGPLSGGAAPQAVTGGVCYCCKTALATGANGEIFAAWRHVYPGNVRDIAFAMSRDGRTFAAPVRVSSDNWVLDGCPENGPAMAAEANGRIHIVWPTLIPARTPASEPTLALFYAQSAGGRRFTARQPVPSAGFPRHPQIALDPRGNVVVMWDEQDGSTRRVAFARGASGRDGAVRFTREVVNAGSPATYPVLAAVPGAIVAVWTSGPPARSVLRTQRFPE